VSHNTQHEQKGEYAATWYDLRRNILLAGNAPSMMIHATISFVMHCYLAFALCAKKEKEDRQLNKRIKRITLTTPNRELRAPKTRNIMPT